MVSVVRLLGLHEGPGLEVGRVGILGRLRLHELGDGIAAARDLEQHALVPQEAGARGIAVGLSNSNRLPSGVGCSMRGFGYTTRQASVDVPSFADRITSPPDATRSDELSSPTFAVRSPRRHGRQRRSLPTGPGPKYDESRRCGADAPADPKQRCQNKPGLGGSALAHAATEKTSTNSGTDSPCSKRSASTRRANAFTRATASSRVVPYTCSR